jgi:hypothetical protein
MRMFAGTCAHVCVFMYVAACTLLKALIMMVLLRYLEVEAYMNDLVMEACPRVRIVLRV